MCKWNFKSLELKKIESKIKEQTIRFSKEANGI